MPVSPTYGAGCCRGAVLFHTMTLFYRSGGGLSSYAELQVRVNQKTWRSFPTARQARHHLSEAILFNAGHTTRLGRVEDGNTTSDYEPEEVNRGGSIQLTLLPYEWNGTKVNLIDTPGYADFFGEVVAALKVADSALLVVCAASGIEVGDRAYVGGNLRPRTPGDDTAQQDGPGKRRLCSRAGTD